MVLFLLNFCVFLYSLFTATLGEFEFCLCSAVCGGGRSQRCPHFRLDFLFGARFWKNSNAFKRKLLIVNSSRFAGLATSARRLYTELAECAHPPRFRKIRLEQDKIGNDFVSKKNAKILQNFLLTQMTHPVDSTRSLKLSEWVIKKEIEKLSPNKI